MKTEWDYTELADAYLMRPDYADAAVDAMLAIAGLEPGSVICDVGAGVAHLTLMLAKRDFRVVAVEPNDAMRENGIKRTSHFSNVEWHEGTGEQTKMQADAFDMVTFGSSFNVCDRQAALQETARILKPSGWFACMWNHRHLQDPVQSRIEQIIRDLVPEYGYGTRREDQAVVIEASGVFGEVVHLDAKVLHKQTVAECVEAWRSHATLQRQAGKMFLTVVSKIEEYLNSLREDVIRIPYSTNIWIARLRG